jgi:hypothetical protein
MRFLLLLLLPCSVYSQPVANLSYKLKEVHNLTVGVDCNLIWKVDTIKYSVPFEIKISETKISIDGYGDYTIKSYENKSRPDTRIDYWELTDSSFITKIDNLMYWEYPMKNKQSRFIHFKIE